MPMIKFGDEEGATCGRNGCRGVIAQRAIENCSCHISPPCGACTTPREWCPGCDWSAEEEDRSFYFNELRCVAVSKEDAKLGMFGGVPLKKWNLRALDTTKIDYHSKSHSNSSMIREGVYPEGTRQADVEDKVRGTFGGRFEQWGGGKFRYIAYTD